MIASTAICVVFAIAAAVMFGITMYYKAENDLMGAVAEFIAIAESTGLPGKEKMKMVVGDLVAMVPASLQAFLNEEALEALTQRVFDSMRKYAKMYVKRNQNKDGNFISEIMHDYDREVQE